MTTVILNKHKEESVLRFHPWIFSGAIRKVVLDKDHRGDAPEEGELVVVQSSEGQTLGVGHWQVGSIAVRILEFFTDHLPDNFWEKILSFANGLRKSARLSREDNNTYRLVHGEGDFLPGLVIDIYDDTAVLQAHSVGMHKAWRLPRPFAGSSPR